MVNGGYSLACRGIATLIRLPAVLYREHSKPLHILIQTHMYSLTLIRFRYYYRRAQLAYVKWGCNFALAFTILGRFECSKVAASRSVVA